MKEKKASLDFPSYTLTVPFCDAQDFVIYRGHRTAEPGAANEALKLNAERMEAWAGMLKQRHQTHEQ
jgi:hypothetical protein